jgi:hypothetical protein
VTLGESFEIFGLTSAILLESTSPSGMRPSLINCFKPLGCEAIPLVVIIHGSVTFVGNESISLSMISSALYSEVLMGL